MDQDVRRFARRRQRENGQRTGLQRRYSPACEGRRSGVGVRGKRRARRCVMWRWRSASPRGVSTAGPVRRRTCALSSRGRSSLRSDAPGARTSWSSWARRPRVSKDWTWRPRPGCSRCCDEMARPAGDGVRLRTAHGHAQGFRWVVRPRDAGPGARSAEWGGLHLRQSRSRQDQGAPLGWDGLCVYAKRLERGRFACLWRDDGEPPIALTISELDLFLDGSTLVGRIALSPPAMTHFSLASDRAT